MDASTRHKKNNPNDGSFKLAVKPHKLKIVKLGTYPNEEEIPGFSFNYSPNVRDSINIIVVATETNDGVRVVAQVQRKHTNAK
jgi:hypothetical protein